MPLLDLFASDNLNLNDFQTYLPYAAPVLGVLFALLTWLVLRSPGEKKSDGSLVERLLATEEELKSTQGLQKKLDDSRANEVFLQQRVAELETEVRSARNSVAIEPFASPVIEDLEEEEEFALPQLKAKKVEPNFGAALTQGEKQKDESVKKVETAPDESLGNIDSLEDFEGFEAVEDKAPDFSAAASDLRAALNAKKEGE